MLKLARIPDRTPIKLTISILPDLSDALTEYTSAYNSLYGRSETVVELLPHIVAAFIENDRAFQRGRAERKTLP